jgi:S1-C subfamily serine protease
VPVDTYVETWERLAKGESWGGGLAMATARLGMHADPESKACKVSKVEAGSAAEKAGLKIDDVITALNGKKIASFDDLRAEIEKRQPGDVVTLEVRRGDETLKLEAKLGKAL